MATCVATRARVDRQRLAFSDSIAGAKPARMPASRVTPAMYKHRRSVHVGRVIRHRRHHQVDDCRNAIREDSARYGGNDSEHHGLDEQHAEQPSATGAERQPCRDFPLSRVRARQHQDRHVEAGDHQHHRQGAHDRRNNPHRHRANRRRLNHRAIGDIHGDRRRGRERASGNHLQLCTDRRARRARRHASGEPEEPRRR